MSKALLWIGGATLATVLLFGGASIAARLLDRTGGAETVAIAPDIEDAIPVDPAKIGNAAPPQIETDPLEDETEADGRLAAGQSLTRRRGHLFVFYHTSTILSLYQISEKVSFQICFFFVF